MRGWRSYFGFCEVASSKLGWAPAMLILKPVDPSDNYPHCACSAIATVAMIALASQRRSGVARSSAAFDQQLLSPCRQTASLLSSARQLARQPVRSGIRDVPSAE
jgi:hypothetical protein